MPSVVWLLFNRLKQLRHCYKCSRCGCSLSAVRCFRHGVSGCRFGLMLASPTCVEKWLASWSDIDRFIDKRRRKGGSMGGVKFLERASAKVQQCWVKARQNIPGSMILLQKELKALPLWTCGGRGNALSLVTCNRKEVQGWQSHKGQVCHGASCPQSCPSVHLPHSAAPELL